MSLDGQWDSVNGEVLRCRTVKASMHHHHQLELYSISDVKLVELLLEQLRQSMIKLARVAGDARSSIEQSLQLFSDSVWSTSKNRIT